MKQRNGKGVLRLKSHSNYQVHSFYQVGNHLLNCLNLPPDQHPRIFTSAMRLSANRWWCFVQSSQRIVLYLTPRLASLSYRDTAPNLVATQMRLNHLALIHQCCMGNCAPSYRVATVPGHINTSYFLCRWKPDSTWVPPQRNMKACKNGS